MVLGRILFVSFFVVLSGCQNTSSENTHNAFSATASSAVAAPVAEKQAYEMRHHGVTRTDNYYWLRDDSRSSPKVLAHLHAENAYSEAKMAHTLALQERLFNEITLRMQKNDVSVPVKYRQFYYYRRYEGEKEYPIYARKKHSLTAPEEVLLDANLLAAGKEYFHVGDYAVSTDETILAYSSDVVGRRTYTIAFKNLNSGELLTDLLEQTTGQVIWANDNKTLFYIRKDPQTLLGYQVYRHELGTDQGKDVLVYEETNSAFFTWLDKTKDDSTVMIVHGSTLSQGVSVLDANNAKGKFSRFTANEQGHEYSVKKRDDWFYILTNWRAKNFRIMRVKANKTYDKNAWQEVIAHNEDVFLEDFDVFSQHLVINEKQRGQSRIRIVNLTDTRSHVVAFNEPVYMAGIDDNSTVDTQVVRLVYGSLTTPTTIYDYNMATRELTLRKQEQVLGDFDQSRYASERVFITAGDGKQIPVSLVYRKDLFKKDSSLPLYIYAYGSYGVNIDPNFSVARLSLLDRGVVYAIAHVRGSQTLGRAWYDDGKLHNKKNTFSDFIDVTKALVEQGYGHPDKVFASGESAGGLLIGAVVNMAPELYLGVNANVPFVDVVTTMLDASIPLTTNEYDEWGNPANEADFHYMLSYSPYDNVVAQDYPHILVSTGLHDSQVQYFEPAKWVAKLRELKTDANLLLLSVNMEAGHGGASGRFRRNRERALEYAFYLSLLDWTETHTMKEEK